MDACSAPTSANYQIYRVCLSRAMSTNYQCGSACRVSVQLMSEFRDDSADNTVLRRCTFRFNLKSASSAESAGICAKPVKISKNCYFYDLAFPDTVGKYQLVISVECDDNSFILIPMTSDVFELAPTLPAERGVLLSAYWRYDTLGPDSPLVMREEFGSTLGSHVWDSAVVFTRHLNYCLDRCQLSKRETAVELGAGCGLAGIAVSKFFERVVITDKACNVPFMRCNISINCCEDIVRPAALDWASASDIAAFTETNADSIDLIIAADVLYDIPAANLLFSLLKIMSAPEKTCILLGQKLRPLGDHTSRFDITALPDFDAERIVEEAHVIIWKIVPKKM